MNGKKKKKEAIENESKSKNDAINDDKCEENQNEFSSSKKGFAQRAFHPEEIKNDPFNLLKIDKNWYLESQIEPPTTRLCEPIDGTSSQQIAICLGMDPSKYKHSNYNNEDEELVKIVDIPDIERYKSCEKIYSTCFLCNFKFPLSLGGIALPNDLKQLLDDPANQKKMEQIDPAKAQNGLQCPKCDSPVDLTWLENKLTIESRKAVGKYYEGWLVSDDPSAKFRTKQQSVLGRAFSMNGRRLQLEPDYTATQLYEQLKYIEALVDHKRALEQLEKSNQKRKDEASIIKPPVCDFAVISKLEKIKDTIHREYIGRSAYNWIKPDIFNIAFKIQN